MKYLQNITESPLKMIIAIILIVFILRFVLECAKIAVKFAEAITEKKLKKAKKDNQELIATIKNLRGKENLSEEDAFLKSLCFNYEKMPARVSNLLIYINQETKKERYTLCGLSKEDYNSVYRNTDFKHKIEINGVKVVIDQGAEIGEPNFF